MKKNLIIKSISSALAVAMMAIPLASCAGGAFDYKTAKLDKYVYVDNYKGVQVEEISAELTQEDIDAALEQLLSENATTKEVTDRAVKEGDTISLNFEGYHNGVKFDGGSAENQEVTVGAGGFIDGFEDGLIGLMPGVQTDVNVTFPNPYENNPTLAGQPAVFKMTVNFIKETVLPEFNDDYAKANSTYLTADEYLTALKTQWKSEKATAVEQQMMANVWSKIVESATFHELPESRVEKYYNDVLTSYQSQAAQYGVDLATLLSYMGASEEELKQYASDYATSIVKEELVFHYIAKTENFTVSEEDYQTELARYAGLYELTAEELVTQYGEDTIRESITWDKLIEYLSEQAVVVPATTTAAN